MTKYPLSLTITCCAQNELVKDARRETQRAG